VDAPGFSQSQQRRLADLVLGQRGGLRKLEEASRVDEALWALLCLRLAVIKCHGRGEVNPKALKLRRQGNLARLQFSAEWAASHPRTLHLLGEEVAAWSRSALPLRLQLDALR
jgi:exopolyphosphatase/guanosine-5'-triphosphate,3'-diphosphate pyrophosphatase